MTPLTWFLIAALILVNGFYVAAEFSAVSVRRSAVRARAEEKEDPGARRLLPHIEDPTHLDTYVAACQIGITLSSLLLGAYGQAAITPDLAVLLAGWADLGPAAALSTAALVVLVGLTTFQVIFGELVPKSMALQFPIRAAILTVAPMEWSLRAYRPFIALLNGSGNGILRLLRLPPGSHRHLHRPEEIDLLIAESRDGGLLEPDEHRRLRRALRLSREPVQRMMVPRTRVHAIPVETTGDEALRKALESPYTRIPVYRNTLDDVVGMLHTKDLVAHYVEHGRVERLDPLIRPLVSIPETLTADRLLMNLREKRSHQAVIVDEYGGTEGLVTLEDVLTTMLGEVGDEFKERGVEVEELADGRIRIPGWISLGDATPWIEVPPSGSSTTVGGLVMEILGHVPEEGEEVVVNGTRLEVEAVRNNAVLSVIAARPEGGVPEDG